MPPKTHDARLVVPGCLGKYDYRSPATIQRPNLGWRLCGKNVPVLDSCLRHLPPWL